MIYLDNNATTRLDPKVLQAIVSIYELGPLNPSAIHGFGKKGKEKILQSRDWIAKYFGVLSKEIYFTSSSTESLTTLIRGFVHAKKAKRILSTKIEHNAIDSLLRTLRSEGVVVDTIEVDLHGAPKLEQLIHSIHPSTDLVILSSVYSETGVMLDLEVISEFLYQKKIPLIIDATAHIGKAPFKVFRGISAFCLSAHKFHGPQGVGMMFARTNFPFTPLLVGGHQEMHRRAGTENIAGIVGLQTALSLIEESSFSYMQELKEMLLSNLCATGSVNGSGPTICNTLNIAFSDVDAENLMIRLDQCGVCVSMGSACSSGSIEPSRVLLEMGVERSKARSSLRFSLSRFNTKQEIEKVIQILQELLSVSTF